MNVLTYKQTFLKLAEKLRTASNFAPEIDARALLCYSTGKPLEYILSHPDEVLTLPQMALLDECAMRRIGHEPVAYITGCKEFYGRSFLINKDVLIPRPDTELLIDVALRESAKLECAPSILELGTGSGCIIITLALELAQLMAGSPRRTPELSRNDALFTAVDISDAALGIAKQNAAKYELADKINFIKSDWFAEVAQIRYDFIVANPPYIAHSETDLLAHETYKYEPHLALFGGSSGLASYQIITQNAHHYLAPNGKIIVEIGFDQGAAVAAIFASHGYTIDAIVKDLSGHDRVVVMTMHDGA